jgi:anti-anti-sigma regulatory factor
VLRISVELADSWIALRLEGKVIGPWVEECHRAWESIRADLGSKQLRLDLRGVTFVDGRGTELLREIRQISGAEVMAGSPLTKYFAEQIARKIEKTEEEGV